MCNLELLLMIGLPIVNLISYGYCLLEEVLKYLKNITRCLSFKVIITIKNIALLFVLLIQMLVLI